MALWRTTFLVMVVLGVCGFTLEEGTVTDSVTTVITDPPAGQPAEERAAQDRLPQSHDGSWDILGQTKINFDEKSGLFQADVPQSLKDMSGKTMKISGFILPLEASDTFTHFLLSKRTPTCPFCPPGAPNEIIEVIADVPTEWDEGLVTYEGEFEVTNNAELGVFFKLKDAQRK